MHQIICRSAGASPHTPLGELTALSQTPSWFRGGALWEKSMDGGKEGRQGEGRWKEKEGVPEFPNPELTTDKPTLTVQDRDII